MVYGGNKNENTLSRLVYKVLRNDYGIVCGLENLGRNRKRIKEREWVVFMNPQDVCYYDHVRGELKGSQLSKAKKFCRLDLVKVGLNHDYVILPIKGYNTRTYHIDFHKFDNLWHCDCQFNHQTKKMCSHIMAVLIWRRTRGEVVM